MSVTVIEGDCRAMLASLADESVQACVTSPPYFGLRDYGHDGQIGLEDSPDRYVIELVSLFASVRRVLRADGTLWLNLGDSYAGSGRGAGDTKTANKGNGASRGVGSTLPAGFHEAARRDGSVGRAWVKPPVGFKAKDLLGIPWRVAFALQADGWYLRSDIIWHKPNPMPESVVDRPTKAHEYVFLLSKSPRYFYDAKAISEPSGGWKGSAFDDGKNAIVHQNVGKHRSGNKERKYRSEHGGIADSDQRQAFGVPWEGDTRNARSVWPIPTQPFKGAHFATMPPELASRCILAGSRPGDVVLDPFGGAGTTGLVADRLGRDAVLIEINAAYAAMARARIASDAPLLAEVS